MIQNSGLFINQQIKIKQGAGNRPIIWGLIIVVFSAAIAIICSKFYSGFIAFFPIIVLFFVFVKYYELGLICFVFSFAYQAPAISIPALGLSAFIRLDEMIFIPIFLVWLLRVINKKTNAMSITPLKKPLLFYVLVVFISLLVQYDSINSTPFLNTATGLKGLTPLLLKLTEAVGGYFMLADPNITHRTKRDMFWCLLIVVTFAVTLGMLVIQGVISKESICEATEYDPTSFYTRFSLYGNTSAWGVLLIIYFFLILHTLYSASFWIRIVNIICLIFCIYLVMVSGAKTAMTMLIIGTCLLMLKKRKKVFQSLRIVLTVLVAIPVSLWLVLHFATETQKLNTYIEFTKVFYWAGAGEMVEESFRDTSLGTRYDHWFRFGNTIKSDPALLALGRGWQRRLAYPEDTSLHNDVLTLCHDLGILGVIFVVWLYFAMVKQFIKKNTDVLCEESNILRSIMQILVISLLASSFTGENLTFYPGIDVQFPCILMVMAITGNYLKTLERCNASV